MTATDPDLNSDTTMIVKRHSCLAYCRCQLYRNVFNAVFSRYWPRTAFRTTSTSTSWNRQHLNVTTLKITGRRMHASTGFHMLQATRCTVTICVSRVLSEIRPLDENSEFLIRKLCLTPGVGDSLGISQRRFWYEKMLKTLTTSAVSTQSTNVTDTRTDRISIAHSAAAQRGVVK